MTTETYDSPIDRIRWQTQEAWNKDVEARVRRLEAKLIWYAGAASGIGALLGSGVVGAIVAFALR